MSLPLWIVIVVLADTIPLPLIKAYVKSNNYLYLIISILLYIILIYTYIKLLLTYNVSSLYPTLKIFSILVVVGYGILILKEKLHLLNYIGLILGILAIFLLLKK